MIRLRKFLALGWPDRFLLLEAGLHLGAARLALAFLPFRHISRHLGRQVPAQSCQVENGEISPMAARIAQAVDRMSRFTPWDSACLAQAIAARYMLHRRGVASCLHLGTRKDRAGGLLAHAWLDVGGATILGGSASGAFTPLASFQDSPKVRSPHERPGSGE